MTARWKPWPTVIAVALAMATGTALALVVASFRTRPASAAGRETGVELAAGLVGALSRAGDLRAPYRCARLSAQRSGAASSGAAGGRPGAARVRVLPGSGRRLTRRGDRVIIGPAAAASGKRPHARPRPAALVVGVVADARGATPATLRQLAAIRKRFEAAGVELVISLGGMAEHEPALERLYGALARGARWPLVAIPGDREALPAHRAAVAQVDASGHAYVIDGSAVRLIAMDGAVVATFPGVAAASQLVAGADGCRHSGEDADRLAALLSREQGVRIWAGYAPPRQRGQDASDVARGGIHIGERGLAPAIAASGADLVVHGLVDEAALGPARGEIVRARPDHTAVVAAGAAEARRVRGPDRASIHGSALIITAGAKVIRWRRIRLGAAGIPRRRR